jgi:hypothetical protein
MMIRLAQSSGNGDLVFYVLQVDVICFYVEDKPCTAGGGGCLSDMSISQKNIK